MITLMIELDLDRIRLELMTCRRATGREPNHALLVFPYRRKLHLV